jgi:hypothetical protein
MAAGLVLGAVIGIERELHRQPAGFRTHSLVAVGRLFTIISASQVPGSAVDPTRIAAQIVSGIQVHRRGTILQHAATSAADHGRLALVGGRHRHVAGARMLAIAGRHRLILVVLAPRPDRVRDNASGSEERAPDGETDDLS